MKFWVIYRKEMRLSCTGAFSRYRIVLGQQKSLLQSGRECLGIFVVGSVGQINGFKYVYLQD